MGQLVRLNTVFANQDLPVIIDRNIAVIEAEIRALPSLRAFWDFGDSSVRTMSGDKITRIADKSAVGNHLTAEIALAPTLDGSILGGASSAYFDVNHGMTSSFSAFETATGKLTFVAFAMKSEATNPANTVLLCGKSNATVSVYTNNNNIAINSANLFLTSSETIVGKPLSIVASTDFTTHKSTIQDDYRKTSGTDLTARKLKSEPIYIGKWTDGADTSRASGWKGYIGHVMVFDGYLEDNQYVVDLLLEYARRKYNTAAWE